jgi:hypothetical protein
MPFNPINFLNAPVSRHPLHGLIEALAQGYQTGQMPAKMYEEQQQRQLDNAAKAMQNKDYPAKFAAEQEGRELTNDQTKFKNGINKLFGFDLTKADLDLKRAQADDVSSPFHQLGKFSGSGKDAYELDLFKNQFGEDSDIYKNAKKAFDSKLSMQNALVNYRGALTNTADKRASTQLGKLQLEKEDVADGYLPGSNRTIEISPEEQKALMGRYDLQEQKISSDVDTRKRALFASNIDKTLDSINVDDLTQYAGFAGKLEQKIAQGGALTGEENKKYESFQKSLVGAQLLAKQVRQFYGDSITPQVQEKLGQLTNPSAWSNNPKIAKQNFQQFAGILKKETETYRNSLKNTSEFSSKRASKKPSGSPPPGTVLGKLNGTWHYIPEDEIDEFLSEEGATIDGQ